MNIYLIIILTALIGEYILQAIAKYLNLKSLKTELPDEFKGFYDEEEYRKSQKYTRTNTKFSYVVSTFDIILIVAFILMGGFNYIDQIARGFDLNPVFTGLIFFGILYFAQDIISIPFSLYNNFVIEERFGFNKMTIKTFVLDKLKSYLLVILLGSILLGGILFFFEKAGEYAWLYAWGLVSFFILIGQPLYTTVIAPIFNKFTPLEDEELKQDIEEYADKVDFPLKEIAVMDGSRRTAHSNAYFSGIGKKRVALYDTLIEEHSNDELVAVVAHEIGHYKKHHIVKGMIISIIHTGILLYLLSLFISKKALFDAFQMEYVSVYAGLVFFGLLYSPVELLLSVGMNYLSRKYEYEADNFAVKTLESKESMIKALKNLFVSNLGNLTPHQLNVVLNHSHPPVLERVRAIRSESEMRQD